MKDFKMGHYLKINLLGICCLVFSCIGINNISMAAVNNTSCYDNPALKEVKKVVDQNIVELESKKGQIKNNPKVVNGIINDLLVPRADFTVMSQLVLTTNWKKLTSDEQVQFAKEFERLMIRTYGVAFEAYNGETVDFNCPVRKLQGKNDRVEVSTTIHHPSQPDNIVKFRILKRNKSCDKCQEDTSACKQVGEKCITLKSKADSEFETCKTQYDTCRKAVDVCRVECSKCQNCDQAKDDCSSRGSWLVYDLIIDNISIIDSYRQVFADKFRAQKSAAKIIADMHAKNCKDKTLCD